MRDRALLAFGMGLAARRSELVALDVVDLEWDDQGVRVTVRRSKTDQEGGGAVVAVPEGRYIRRLAHLERASQNTARGPELHWIRYRARLARAPLPRRCRRS